MLAKAKARDVIPGWPKGRSTMSPYPNLHGGMLIKALRLRMPFMCSQSELVEHLADGRKLEFEEQYETTYHQMQQAMVNEWFASYRIPPTKYSWELLGKFRYVSKQITNWLNGEGIVILEK